MNVYIHDCEFYCENCAEAKDEGPFPNGGGEADYFQHCANCGIFLDNPLTREGIEYTKDAIREKYKKGGKGNGDVIYDWMQVLIERGIIGTGFPYGEDE